MSGKFILLEGGEGVGKTTQAALMIEQLKGRGITAELVREPGGDHRAESIRSLLLHDSMKGLEALAELFLFCAARAQVMATKVAPKLDSGTWVIADRGSLSSKVYQGHVKGVNLEHVEEVCRIAMGRCVPDLVLVLDAPVEIALGRRLKSSESNRFEAEGLAFHQRINQMYIHEAQQCGYVIVNAVGSVLEVTTRLWVHVEPLMAQ